MCLYLRWHQLLIFSVIPALLLPCLYPTDAFQAQQRGPGGIHESVLRRKMPQAAVGHDCCPWEEQIAPCCVWWCPLGEE